MEVKLAHISSQSQLLWLSFGTLCMVPFPSWDSWGAAQRHPAMSSPSPATGQPPAPAAPRPPDRKNLGLAWMASAGGQDAQAPVSPIIKRSRHHIHDSLEYFNIVYCYYLRKQNFLFLESWTRSGDGKQKGNHIWVEEVLFSSYFNWDNTTKSRSHFFLLFWLN